MRRARLDNDPEALDSSWISGGTYLRLQQQKTGKLPERLVNSKTLFNPGFICIREGNTLRINASSTLNELINHADLQNHAPQLVEVINGIATESVRNLATLGGNIGWRRGDSIPYLLLCQATLETITRETLVSKQAIVREYQPIKKWIDGNDNSLICTIIIPVENQRKQLLSHRNGSRKKFSVSDLTVCIGLEATGVNEIAFVAADIQASHIHVNDSTTLANSLFGPVNEKDFFNAVKINPKDQRWVYLLLRRLIHREQASSSIQKQSVAPNRIERYSDESAKLQARKDWRARREFQAEALYSRAYISELPPKDHLYIKVYRSQIAHAEILDLQLESARALPGVIRIITAQDIPGQKTFGILNQDQPVLAETIIRYLGEAIALVVAETMEVAEAACQKIGLKTKLLPVIDSFDKAKEATTVLHGENNICHSESWREGDIDSIWKKCAHIVEETYSTPIQLSTPMETEGGYAEYRDGQLILRAGTQAGTRNLPVLASIIDIDPTKLRIISGKMGGAFGSKDELTVEHHLALASHLTGSNTRLIWSREESNVCSIKRHAYRIKMKTGCDEAGMILGHEVTIESDTGAYASLGPTVLFNSVEHAKGAYKIKNCVIDAKLYYTNNGVAGACRGFGVPQIMFALEQQISRLATLSKLSPFEFRLRNLRNSKDKGPFGQTIANSPGAKATLNQLASENLCCYSNESTIYSEGFAIATQCDGLGKGIDDPCAARLTLIQNGKIRFDIALEEFGQGLRESAIIQVAKSLDTPLSMIEINIGDSALDINSGTTTASRGSSLISLTLARLLPQWSEKIDLIIDNYCHNDVEKYRQLKQKDPESFYQSIAALRGVNLVVETSFNFPETPDGRAFSHLTYAYNATRVLVSLNVLTGSVSVVSAKMATQCGKVIDCSGYQGQMEGAFAMALGWTLTESNRYSGSKLMALNFDASNPPGIADVPQLAVIACEENPEHDPHADIGGAGEIGFDSVAPAIADAINRAIGLHCTSLPITQKTLLNYFAENQKHG